MEDFDLLNELALTQPTLDEGSEYLGRVLMEDGESWVDVTKHMPLKCWDFSVFAADGNRQYQVSTGSGDLADYWPTVEQLADGMLIVSMVDGEPAEPA